ncbi:MAG TPA: peptidoglycan DD-metalloendopeptidase family protein [Candidatus Saccharimonadales bacterium]|nr:peptidoglycan DD-metalloendopeptidase family protein [Candidatus Saccharimonadales bacterium]
MNMHEPLEGLFTSSRLLILDFAGIPAGTPAEESMQQFFALCERRGINPRLPEQRQAFNDRLLKRTGARYLVSRYGEDRAAMLAGSEIARQGRTLHIGIDVFCRNLETVYAPCDGDIIRTGQEPEDHSYGYYLVLRPRATPDVAFFFGHLSARLPALGPVRAGQPIARLGDFTAHENGGWSRHLHIQMVKELPPKPLTPDGYATPEQFAQAAQNCPSPLPYFPEWQIST